VFASNRDPGEWIGQMSDTLRAAGRPVLHLQSKQMRPAASERRGWPPRTAVSGIGQGLTALDRFKPAPSPDSVGRRRGRLRFTVTRGTEFPPIFLRGNQLARCPTA
jgi:hypothetical protein